MIGVLGGTFDPPHIGHLILAEEARVQLGLDYVWFVPTGDGGHKQEPIANRFERLEMVRLSIAENHFMGYSLIDIEREGPTYTVDTLKEIHELSDDKDIVLVIGSDQAMMFHSWKSAAVIAKKYRIAVGHRPGKILGGARGYIRAGIERYFEEIYLPPIDISSTAIRKRVKDGRSIRYLVPEIIHDLCLAMYA